MSALPTTGLTPVDGTQLPANIQHGTAAQKKAYETALGFEQILVGQLAQELAKTASTHGSDGSSPDDGSSGDGSSGDSGASGLMGSDPASSMYAQLLPEALTSSIMSAGGTGMAQQIAAALDPSLGSSK